ncbi:MAG: DUF3048 domain-containing protein [Acidimicrobiia bacterium]|nr:DUF3048 domain-containing protein [Acidimicrobiia bacterium]
MRRTAWYRLLTLLLVLALAAAACGSDGDSDSGDTTASDESDESDESGDEAELETVTIPESDRPIEPLTGEDLTDEGLLDQPAYAIKIDNDDRARPQNGLGQADVIFEILVEANKTRFLAVFHSEIPAEAGPTRSARSSDFDVLASLGTPVFAYAGSNPGVASEISSAASDGVLVPVNIDAIGSPTSFRDSERPAPHNLVSVPSEAIAAAGGEPGSPAPIFAYRDPSDVGDAGSGGGVELSIGDNTSALHLWGGGLNGWGRYQNGTAHLDHDGVQVAPTNLVVLEITYGSSASDSASPEAVTVGDGPALVARNGEILEGTWARGSGADPFQLTGADGEPLLLDPGSTWVALARQGDYEVLTPGDAFLRAQGLAGGDEG